MAISSPKALLLPLIVVAALVAQHGSAAAQGASGNAHPPAPIGVWVGAGEVNSQSLPFRIEIRLQSGELGAALINRKERSEATSVAYANGHLIAHFDYYANALDATIANDTLAGNFSGRGHNVPVQAKLNGNPLTADANAPHIGGVWEVAVNGGAKGEHTWKVRVRQTGATVAAVIERIDGDTGSLYGVWHDGAYIVSRFTAAGPNFAVLRPQPDGTLLVETAAHGGSLQSFSAHRASGVRTIALENTDDPLHHTYLKDPKEPFQFRFPDLSGKLVTSSDSEFANKVLIVGIGGSWCPNCQDEAPFLEALYRKYHNRGLEIVELSFEESSQLENPSRLRAVIQKYGITYPVLIAGTPDQLSEKFPRVANLNCWPTTFFVGRNGLVSSVHTGYAGPATGKDNHDLKNEITTQVERLLVAKPSSVHAKSVQVARTP